MKNWIGCGGALLGVCLFGGAAFAQDGGYGGYDDYSDDEAEMAAQDEAELARQEEEERRRREREDDALPVDEEFETDFELGVVEGSTTSGEITLVIISVEEESDVTEGAVGSITLTPVTDDICYLDRGGQGYICTDEDNPNYGTLEVGIHLVDGDSEENSEVNMGGGTDVPGYPASGDYNVGETHGSHQDHPFDPIIDDMLQEDLSEDPVTVQVPVNPNATGDNQTSLTELLDMDQVSAHDPSVRDELEAHLQEAMERQRVFEEMEDDLEVRRLEEEEYARQVMDDIRKQREEEIEEQRRRDEEFLQMMEGLNNLPT